MKKSNNMYFVSGVSGVGKTTIIPFLKELLSDTYEIHDFDERGVPDGVDHSWRKDETRQWISFGKRKAEIGVTVVICGFSNPDEIKEIINDFPNLEVITILLDGEADVIEQRLRKRNIPTHTKKKARRKTLRAFCLFYFAAAWLSGLQLGSSFLARVHSNVLPRNFTPL